MHDSAEGNQFIVVIPDKGVPSNEIRNVIYYSDMEECDLLLVNMVEENEEGLSHRDKYGARDARRVLEIYGYLSQTPFYK